MVNAAEIETTSRLEAGRAGVPVARVAILGATGYAGRELIAWLAHHPSARIVCLMSSGRDGREPFPVEEVHPVLRGASDAPVEPMDLDSLAGSSPDLVFLATPHEVSHEVGPALLDRGLRVVDLSGAFRLKDSALYLAWYGFEHRRPEALEKAVYGIPEMARAEICEAGFVANPGCYATSVALALAPLLRAGLVDVSQGIVCDSKSGASGAGRSLRDDLLFSSVNENCRAYALFSHRHVPEMLQALGLPAQALTFTPHLLPVTRGILSTIYVRLLRQTGSAQLDAVFRDFYAHAPLVRLCRDGRLPELQGVAHTPFADIGWALDSATNRLIVVSALDNLGKGAATQAIQNMNLMFGFAEDAGLR